MDNVVQGGLAIEPTPAAPELIRQRAITEQFLLAALQARDASDEAVAASRRATFLATATRELAVPLDDETVRERIARRALPRDGGWYRERHGIRRRRSCCRSRTRFGAARRGSVFADRWSRRRRRSVPARAIAALGRSEEDDAVARRALGFGGFLVVPLVVRARVVGAITFVTREGDPPFSTEEVALARDLADICALALENERLYRRARELSHVADLSKPCEIDLPRQDEPRGLMTALNAIGGYVSLIEMGLRGREPCANDRPRGHSAEPGKPAHADLGAAHVRANRKRPIGVPFSAVSVQGILHDVADTLRGAVDERRFALVHWPSDGDAMMWIDPDRARQVLVNLVMNAVKYATAAGGPITLSLATTPQTVSISVTDTGPGIPAEKLVAIFEPFVQLASGLTERRGGVGLGLTISRDLARAMKGDLTVESIVGVGSRFTLQLPRAGATISDARGGHPV